jgi:hypothetical protein
MVALHGTKEVVGKLFPDDHFGLDVREARLNKLRADQLLGVLVHRLLQPVGKDGPRLGALLF